MSSLVSLPQGEILSQDTSSYFVPSRSESLIVQSIRNIGRFTLMGCGAYGGVKIAKHLNWMQVANIYPSAYIISFAAGGLVQEIIRGIGHNWKVIKPLSLICYKIDKFFCQLITKAGFKLRPIQDVSSIEEQYMSAAERMRKIFGEALKEFVIELATFQTITWLLSRRNVFWMFNPQSVLRMAAGTLIFGICFVQPGEMDRCINQQREADYYVSLFARELGYDLKTVTEIDLREFSCLNPLFFKKLLAKCPHLQKIQMHLSDIEKIEGFDTQVDKRINIQLTPFSAYEELLNAQDGLIRHLTSDYFDKDAQNRPVHGAIIAQFPILKWAVNGYSGFIDRSGKMVEVKPRTPEHKIFIHAWLDVAYKGQFPLYFLNQISYNLLQKESMVDKSQFSDFTLICKDKKTIPVHKVLLLKCPYFRTLFDDILGGPSYSDNDFKKDFSTWDRETVLRAVRFIYDAELDFDFNSQSIEAAQELLEIAREWKLNELSTQLEKKSVAYLQANLANQEKVCEFKALAISYNMKSLKSCCKTGLQLSQEGAYIKEFENAQIQEDRVRELLEEAKIHKFEQLKLRCLNYLHEKSPVKDFTINVGTQILNLSQMFLKYQSPYFEKLIAANPDLKEINDSTLDPKAIRQALLFIYTNECPTHTYFESYYQLLKVAVEWELDALKDNLLKNQWSLRLELEAKAIYKIKDKDASATEIQKILQLAEKCQLHRVLEEAKELDLLTA